MRRDDEVERIGMEVAMKYETEYTLVKTNAVEIRVWCVGCATGEEAYSLAMLFAEALIHET